MHGNEWQSDYYAGDQMNILTVGPSQDCNFPLLFVSFLGKYFRKRNKIKESFM